jgi:hypothetical protein
MTPDQELIDALRSAIFLAALQLWEEGCTWEELSDDQRHIYDEYAKAAADAAIECFAPLVREAQRVRQRADAASVELAAVLNERDELREHVTAMTTRIECSEKETALTAELFHQKNADLYDLKQEKHDCEAGLREQVLAMAAQIEAAIVTGAELEYAGCDAIAALRAVSSNPGLSDAQHALVAEALLGMFAAKPRWLSRPAEIGRIPPNSEGAP